MSPLSMSSENVKCKISNFKVLVEIDFYFLTRVEKTDKLLGYIVFYKNSCMSF